VIGQKGINFIEHVVLGFGSRWTPNGPNEIGIDGFIELFDPNSHQSLGLNLAVQSKVVNSICKNPDPTFEYFCNPNDVEYWLTTNIPLILIVSCPDSQEGYWISIKEYFKNWTHGKRASITFIKSQHRFNQDSFRELLKIAVPASGLKLAPARRQETLHTNLLTLETYPPTIYIAQTEYRSYHEVRAVLREHKMEAYNAWVLWEGKMLAFHDLSEQPWVKFCDMGTLEGFSTAEWAVSEDPTRQRIFVQLLNQTLKEQISSRVRYWHKEDCYAIAGRPRKIAYPSLKRTSQISVVSRFSTITTKGKEFEWFRHMAFKGQFRFLDGTWYLEITPTYRFTRDGYSLDHFHEDRLKGIKSLEGNRAVLSSILFWSDYLRPKINMFDNDLFPLQFGKLLTFTSDIGIIDKDWLTGDPDFNKKDISESGLLIAEFDSGITL